MKIKYSKYFNEETKTKPWVFREIDEWELSKKENAALRYTVKCYHILKY